MEKKVRRHKKLKIVSLLGTRPEIIRLSRILPELDRFFNHVTVYTNQNFDAELSTLFVKDLDIRAFDYTFRLHSQTLAEQIGSILIETEKMLKKEMPDGLFVLGDTNSSLGSIVARRMHIPIFHMEAGNRAFDRHVPEEVNRRIVDHISTYNFCYTEHSRRNLLSEGLHGGSLFVTGSPLPEVFMYYREKISASNALNTLKLLPQKYFLLSAHREENVDSADTLQNLFSSAEHIAKQYNFPVVVSLHPRTKKRLGSRLRRFSRKIIFSKPFGFFDYNKLQMHAACVLSDSGSVPEEAAILGFPAVQIRVSTERPEAYEKGNVVLTGLDKEAIRTGIEMVRNRSAARTIPLDYQDTNVSEKVARLIQSMLVHHRGGASL